MDQAGVEVRDRGAVRSRRLRHRPGARSSAGGSASPSSSGSPMYFSSPSWTNIARWQIDCTVDMSWVTSTTVLPCLRRSWNTSMHFWRERGVADREHLVDQHDVGVRLHHHRERQAHHHSRGVVLELEIDEVLAARRTRARRPAGAGLAPGQSHQDPVELAVLARGQLRVEAHPELDEGRHPARHPHPSRHRRGRCWRGSSAACSCRSRFGRRCRRTHPGGRRMTPPAAPCSSR